MCPHAESQQTHMCLRTSCHKRVCTNPSHSLFRPRSSYGRRLCTKWNWSSGSSMIRNGNALKFQTTSCAKRPYLLAAELLWCTSSWRLSKSRWMLSLCNTFPWTCLALSRRSRQPRSSSKWAPTESWTGASSKKWKTKLKRATTCL